MKTFLLPFLLIWMGTTSAVAKSPAEVKSNHGRFVVSYEGENCRLSFQPKAGTPVPLFSIETCNDAWARISSVEKIGNLLLPTGDGVSLPEFHIFTISTARGGNFCEGDDIHVVEIDRGHVRGSSAEGACATLDTAGIVGGTTLVLQDNATTTTEGTRFEVRQGKMSTTAIPRLASAVVSSQVLTVTGPIEGGSHAANYLNSIGDYTIDHAGPCNIDSAAFEQVYTMKIRVDEFDDGRKEVTCLAMQPTD